jgi:uncharacterized repeat protein (TIGR01451 family)
MRKLAVIVAFMLVWAALGCQSSKPSRAKQQSQRGSVETDPFFSVNYPPTDTSRRGSRAQQSTDPIDQIFAQQGNPLQDYSGQDAGAMAQPNREAVQPVPSSRVNPSLRQDTTQPAAPKTPARGVLTQDAAAAMNPRTGAAGTKGQNPAGAAGGRMDVGDTLALAESGPQHISLIYPSPEYGIIKLDKLIPQEVDVSVPFKYSMVMTNMTNTILTNVVVTETTAPNFLLKGAMPVPQKVGENQLVWKLDSLGPKASERIEITGTPASLEPLRHSTFITYGLATVSNISVVQSTLELSRKVPMEALLGDPFAVEYVVKNTGTGTAREVTVTEPLPAGMMTAEGGSEVKFEVGSLRSGQSQTLSTQLKASRTGTFVGKATAFSNSNAQVESVAMPVTIRKAVLAINRSGPERIYLGRAVTYEISVQNQGDGAATSATLENVLPTGVTNIQATPVAEVSGAKLTWTLGTIGAKASKTVRVSFKPATTGILNSTATAAAHGTEAVNAAFRTAVVGAPAIRLHVVDQEDPQQVGGTVTYVIRAVNEGSASDHGIQVMCDLEDSIQYISSSGPTQPTLAGHTLNLGQLRSLGPGEEASWRVVTKAIRAGSVRFKAVLSSEGLSRPIEETEATLLYE